jgi:MFS family permease
VPKNEHSQTERKHELLRIIPNILIAHKRTFLTAGIAIFFLSILRAGRQLLIPIWGHTIGLDTSEIGLIASVAAGADMVMFPLAGYMMDNWGRKHAAVACMSVLSLGLLLVPWSTTFTTLCLFAVLTGIGNGLGSGINMILGSDFAPQSERGEFLGVWRLTSDTGSFGGPLLVGLVSKTFQLTLVFPFLASLGLVGVLMVIFLVRETLSQK